MSSPTLSFVLALGIVLIAFLLGWVVGRGINRWLDRVRQGLDRSGMRADLDIASLAYGLGWLVTFLTIFIATEIPNWLFEAQLTLVTGTSLAAAAVAYVMSRGLGMYRGSVWAMTLVIGALVFSARFNFLTQAADALDGIAFTFLDYRISLWDIGRVVLLILIVYGVGRLLFRIVRLAVRARDGWDAAQKSLAEKLFGIAIITLGAIVVITSAGLDSTMLSVFSGTLGIGLGFGLQKIFSNLVSGIILLMDRSIKPGDIIAVGDTFGEVRSIGVRAVSVATRSGKVFLIPNETLVTDKVENWAYSTRQIGVQVQVDVAYDSDLTLVKKLMLQAARDTARTLTDPKPVVWITELLDTGIRHELHFWISDPEEGLGNIQSEVYRRVLEMFDEHEIKMPSPMREVHVTRRDV